MRKIGDFIIDYCGVLTKYVGTDSDVVIPDWVTEIGSYAFSYRSDIEKVTVGKEVKTIGSGAFSECENLKEIVIRDSVDEIKDNAFYHCKSLKNITFGKNLRIIGDSAFYGCSYLESIDLPDGVEYIGNRAFYECKSVRSLVVPYGVTAIRNGTFCGCSDLETLYAGDAVSSIEDYAFFNCSSLASFDIPISVTSIGNSSFSFCKNLREAKIGDYVKEIGNEAFIGCTSLKSLFIPDSVKSIGIKAFHKCSSLEEVRISSKLNSIGSDSFTECHCIDSVTLKSKASLIKPYGRYGRTVKHTITSFADLTAIFDRDVLFSAFLRDKLDFHSALKSITEKSVKSKRYEIIKMALDRDDQLMLEGVFKYIIRIDISRLDEIINSACGKPEVSAWLMEYKKSHFTTEKLESYESDKEEKALGLKEYSASELHRMFRTKRYGSSLIITEIRTTDSAVFIPSKIGNQEVIGIEGKSRQKNETAESICFESDTTEIGDYAFCGFSSLKSITLPDKAESIGSHAFFGCRSLEEITIPKSVSKIGHSAFLGCTSLRSIDIPDGVTRIENATFSSCTSLRSITIPDSITSIDNSSFCECGNLNKIRLPKSVNDIGYFAFSKCFFKTAGSIGSGADYEFGWDTEIPGYAFSGCFLLKEVSIPDTVSVIGECAFSGCESLNSVKLPSHLRIIEESAFSGCRNMNSVSLPDGVTEIGRFAFSDCTAQDKVLLPDSLKSIGEHAFEDDVDLSGTSEKILKLVYRNKKIEEWFETFMNSEQGSFPFTSILKDDLKKKRNFRDKKLINLVESDNVAELNKFLPLIDSYDYTFLSNLVDYSASHGFTEITAALMEEKKKHFSQGFTEWKEEDELQKAFGLKEYTYNDFRSEYDFAYTDDKVLIKSWLGVSEELVIPEKIFGRRVYAIGKFAFGDCTHLRKVTLPEGLVSIGKYAFKNCSSLEEVVFPASLKYVDSYAFSQCDKMVADLPCSVALGKYIFWTDNYVYGARDIGGFDDLKKCEEIEQMFRKYIPKNTADVNPNSDTGKDKPTESVCGIEIRDKIFVHTGLSEYNESKMEAFIKEHGGIVKSSVVLNTDYLIYNPDYDHETTKLKRAKELNLKGKSITILTFDDFLKAIGNK